MKVAVICFTVHGAGTAVRIREALQGREALEQRETLGSRETLEQRETLKNCKVSESWGSLGFREVQEDQAECVRVWCAKSDFVKAAGDAPLSGDWRIEPLQKPLRQWTEEAFAEYDALVFVGAAGIAVRSIAPFLKSKTSDPAVLCVDELGKFVIPLVSGHIGGANALAAYLADRLEATAVITTATDLNGRFAVDVFAKKNGLWISDMKLAKQISADVLDGKKVGFASDFPVLGEIPRELERQSVRGICVSLNGEKRPFEQTLTLIPRIVSIGVGCKKGTPCSVIEEKIGAALRACGVSMRSVDRLASIGLKAREPGLLEFARKYGLEFVTYTAQELKNVPGEFGESAFVEAVTGVSNVCERSAVLASGGGRSAKCHGVQTVGRSSGGKLIQKKMAGDGVTVALAVRDWSVKFG